MTDEQLQAIRDRLKAATPGPWTAIESMIGGWFIDEVAGPMYIGKDDAIFIACAPEDIAVLLSEVERLRSETKTLRSMYDKCATKLERLSEIHNALRERIEQMRTISITYDKLRKAQDG